MGVCKCERTRKCEWECARNQQTDVSVLAQVHRSANAHAHAHAQSNGEEEDSTPLNTRFGRPSPESVSIGMYMLSQSVTSVKHDVLGTLHLIRVFLRPSSRAPAVERIESARCACQARCEALRGVARHRSFAKRCADPVGKRRKEQLACPALCSLFCKLSTVVIRCHKLSGGVVNIGRV